jgi:hypothetical protein
MTRRSRLALAAALLAALLAAGAIGWALRGPGKQPAPPRPAGLFAQPTRLDHGVPVGWPHTQQGAVAAAAAYTAALSDPRVIFSRARRRQVLGVVGTGQFAASFERRFGPALDQIGASTPIGRGLRQRIETLVLQAPLAYRVVSASGDRVVIETWAVHIVGNRRGVAPRASWDTSNVTVTWSNGDWRISAGSPSSDGPTPVTDESSDPTAVLDRVAASRGFRYVP